MHFEVCYRKRKRGREGDREVAGEMERVKGGKERKKRGKTENYEPVPVSKWYLTRGLNIQKT